MIVSRSSSKKTLMNMPKPYGSIPKHNKRNHKKLQQKNSPSAASIKKSYAPSSTQAPYPFFSSLTPTSTFYTFFHSLFYRDQACQEASPVGFMPCTTLHTTKTQTSELDIIVPVTSPIDCYYDDGGDATYDNCSSFSTSSGSSHSDGSVNSFSSYMEVDDVRNHVRNSLTSNSVSTAALSDILCEHYVQTQMNAPPSSSDDDDDIVDVPLETFCMYEAPPTKHQSWMLGSTVTSKEWTLVETLSERPKRLQRHIEEKEVPVDSKEAIHMDRQYHARDTRTNAAYLRMIVAEVNMMRSQKIVGPLRPRRVLPKRSDRFMHRPSPLQLIMV